MDMLLGNMNAAKAIPQASQTTTSIRVPTELPPFFPYRYI